MKSLLLLVCLCVFSLTAAFGQDGLAVNSSEGSPRVGYQSLAYYDASGNVIYQCIAPSTSSTTTITVTAASNANPVSFTATGHGFDYQSGATITPVVNISGATGNWTPINGEWKATPTGANTFTIAVDSTAFGALTGTLTVKTTAARTTQAQWSIKTFTYDASNRVIWSGWAANPSGAGITTVTGGSTAYDKVCANRTTYAYQ